MKLVFKYVFLWLLWGLTCASAVQAKPKVALVLGGGGALGYAHVGVIKVLEEMGVEIDIVTGVSMGALVGSYYALGNSHEDLYDRVKSVDVISVLDDKKLRPWQNAWRRDRTTFPLVRFSFNDDFTNSAALLGISSAQAVELMLDEMLWPSGQADDFTQFPRAFVTSGTSLRTGKRVVFKEGSLSRAVRASMAIPAVFSPVEINDDWFIDGGVSGNILVQEAYDLGADVVIVVDLSLARERAPDAKVSLIQGLAFALFRDDEAQRQRADVLIQPEMFEYSAGDFGKFDELHAIGEAAARAVADQLARYASTPPGESNITPLSLEPVVLNQAQVMGGTENEGRLALELLGIEFPTEMTGIEMETAVRRMTYRGGFNHVNFSFKEDTLKLHIVPVAPNQLGLYGQFSTDSGLSLGLGLTNEWITSSARTTLYNRLSYAQGLEFKGSLDVQPMSAPAFMYYTEWQLSEPRTNVLRSPQTNTVLTGYRQTPGLYEAELGFGYIYRNLFYVKAGATAGYLHSYKVDNPFYASTAGQTFFGGRFSWVMDQLNTSFMPTSGYMFKATAETGVAKDDGRNMPWHNYTSFSARAVYVQPIFNQLSWLIGLGGGAIWGDNPPLIQFMQAGGLGVLDAQPTSFALPGSPSGSYDGRMLLSFKTALQYSFLLRFMVALEWTSVAVSEQARWLPRREETTLHHTVGAVFSSHFTFGDFAVGGFYSVSNNGFYLVATLGSRF